MNKNLKKIIITIIVLAAVCAGAVYWYQNRQAVQYQEGLYPVSPALAGKTIILSDYVRYPGKDGKNAFELLKNAVGADKVKSKQYDIGVFIEEINGLKPDAEHFWKLYINGKDSQVAADKLETKKGDIIEWMVEKIQK